MHLTQAIVDAGLRDLKRRDRRLKVFGAIAHRYQLNRPVPLQGIEDYERQNSVGFPDDYKEFVTQVGNGGAGPFYGLFPFGQQDDGDGFCKWEEGSLVGRLSEPFTHTRAWNLPPEFWEGQPNPPPGTPIEEEDRLMEEWDRQEEKHYWGPTIMNGAIPICHLGCALRHWLVVTGSQKGFVWADYRADCRGIFPVTNAQGQPQTFSDWYGAWLDEPDAVKQQQPIQ